MTLNFRSDNVGTARPDIMRALENVNSGAMRSYGDDELSAQVNARFSELFETEVTVFPVATGTAANALALASVARPWGAVYCHETAHVHTSEAAATEFYSGGAKLMALPGHDGKLTADGLKHALGQAYIGVRNRSQPDAVTVTQATESGTVYSLAELQSIGEVARGAGLAFHMDGARFANALATLDCSPADMTWRAGVDILSFGATKNGGMNTEAIVVFKSGLVEPLGYRLRRAGHTWSKMRFSSAQLLAYLHDDLYLQSARHSNALARRLAEGLGRVRDAEILWPVQANLIFARLPAAMLKAFDSAGAMVYGPRPDGSVRLVTRFDMPESDVDELLRIAVKACS